VPVAGCVSNANNLIRNPDFATGQSSWNFYSNSGGSFTTTTPGYSCEQAARLQIQQAGSNVQFYQTDIALEPNTEYRLSFAAYSSTGNDIALYLHKHTAHYGSYGLNVDRVDLTTEWKLFTIDFTASGFTAPITDGRLRFGLSTYARAGDSYWIDQVLLTKRSATVATATPTATITPTPTGTSTPVVGPTQTTTSTPTVGPTATNTLTPIPTSSATTTPTSVVPEITATPTATVTPTATAIAGTSCTDAPGNVIRNGTFTEGSNSWTFYTSSSGRFQTVIGDGDCAEVGQIELFASGSNIQLYQADIALQPNTAYRLTFDAKAQNSGDLALYLHKHTAGYTSYGLSVNRVDLTATWQQYTFDFVSSGFTTPINDGRLRIWFSDHGVTGERYQLDNLSLTPINDPSAASAAEQKEIYLPLVNR